MSQYTVFAMYPGDLGDSLTDVDIFCMNECIAIAIEAAGLKDQFRVIVTEAHHGYSEWGSGASRTNAQLRRAVDRGIEAAYLVLRSHHEP